MNKLNLKSDRMKNLETGQKTENREQG